MKKPRRIPNFKTDEEVAEFWETHDFTDYLDDTEEVDIKFVAPRSRKPRLTCECGGKYKPVKITEAPGLEYEISVCNRCKDGMFTMPQAHAYDRAIERYALQKHAAPFRTDVYYADRTRELLDKIIAALSQLSSITTIILYGSTARGEAGPRSDIDLFIITSKNIRDAIESRVIKLEKKIDRLIQPTIRSFKELESTDCGLLQNVFRDGLLIFLRSPMMTSASALLALKPFTLYSLCSERLVRARKRNVHAFAQHYGAIVVSPECLLIPAEHQSSFETLLNKLHISFNKARVWK